jgi:hypothetical protein
MHERGYKKIPVLPTKQTEHATPGEHPHHAHTQTVRIDKKRQPKQTGDARLQPDNESAGGNDESRWE